MKSFTIYEEYYELITLLGEKEQQELLLAITRYMFEDKIPDLNERQTKIFNNLKRPLDASKKNSKRRTKQEPKENQKGTKQQPDENQNNNQKKTHQDVNVNVNNNKLNNNTNLNNTNKLNNLNSNNIFNYIESNFGITISGTNYERINNWLKDYEEIILCYAVDKCIEQGKKTLSYFYAILENWKTSNFKTMEDIKAHEETLRKLREKRNEKPEELFDYNWLEDEEH